MSKKEEILNEILNKGYINQEIYQEKILDESFSDYDALEYQEIAKAYAEADTDTCTDTIKDLDKKVKLWIAK